MAEQPVMRLPEVVVKQAKIVAALKGQRWQDVLTEAWWKHRAATPDTGGSERMAAEFTDKEGDTFVRTAVRPNGDWEGHWAWNHRRIITLPASYVNTMMAVPPIEDVLDEVVPEWRSGELSGEQVVALFRERSSKEMDWLLDFLNDLDRKEA